MIILSMKKNPEVNYGYRVLSLSKCCNIPSVDVAVCRSEPAGLSVETTERIRSPPVNPTQNRYGVHFSVFVRKQV